VEANKVSPVEGEDRAGLTGGKFQNAPIRDSSIGEACIVRGKDVMANRSEELNDRIGKILV